MLWRRKTTRASSPTGTNPKEGTLEPAIGTTEVGGSSSTSANPSGAIITAESTPISTAGIEGQEGNKQPKESAEIQHFALTKWSACAFWSWDVMHDTCVICRNGMMSLCIHCQAKIGTSPLDEICAVAWGVCNHAYHLHCIKRWLESSAHPRCPLDNSEWEFSRYQESCSHDHLAPIDVNKINCFRRSNSTRRVLPKVQITDFGFDRTRSLRILSPSSPHSGCTQIHQLNMSSNYIYPRLSPRVALKHQPRSLVNVGNQSRYNLSSYARTTSERSSRMRYEPPLTKSNDQNIMDDFEYFCRISQAPAGSNGVGSTKTPISMSFDESKPLDSTKMRRQRMIGLRSHSTHHPHDCVDDKSKKWVTRANTQDCILIDPRHEYISVSGGNTSKQSSSKNVAQGSCMSISHPSKRTAGCETTPFGSAISQQDLDADDPTLVEFSLQVVGSPSVGKTLMCQRLAYLNFKSNNEEIEDESDDNSGTFSVRATLEDRIFNVTFSETNVYLDNSSMNIEIQDCIDAFMIVYAVDDATSFEFAKRVFLTLRDNVIDNNLSPIGFIFVGNKTDLVRAREVSTDEGNQFAVSQKAKFVEVSACLDHQIPELLLTVITHLRQLEEDRTPDGLLNRPPPNCERWGTAVSRRRIAVQMNTSNQHQNKSKSFLVKFFKKHFSRSLVDGS